MAGQQQQDGVYTATLKVMKKQLENMPSIRQTYNLQSLNDSQLVREQANLPGTASVGNYSGPGGGGYDQVMNDQKQMQNQQRLN